ncbi:transposase [candidate division WOR-3 bacterium]|nr:transposase [candidate division WOR-3 bacterium]
MARQLRIQYPGALYHVACRGNEYKKIYLGDDDRHRFLKMLEDTLEIYHVVLYCYTMMNNHFHLLVQTKQANLSEFMRRFNICYTGWFNYHHKLCGHLYQGRYKALLVDKDSYLLELSRYIHLNPVRKRHKHDHDESMEYLNKYRWTSLSGYVNEKYAVDYIDYNLILKMAGGRRAYHRFVKDGLLNGVENPFDKAFHQTILGDDAFVAQVKGRLIANGSVREQPTYRDLLCTKLEPTIVLRRIIEALHITEGELYRRERGGSIRGIAADMLYKYCSLTLKQIGQILGDVDYGAVYQLRRRLKDRMMNDDVLNARYVVVEQEIIKMLNVEI